MIPPIAMQEMPNEADGIEVYPLPQYAVERKAQRLERVRLSTHHSRSACRISCLFTYIVIGAIASIVLDPEYVQRHGWRALGQPLFGAAAGAFFWAMCFCSASNR